MGNDNDSISFIVYLLCYCCDEVGFIRMEQKNELAINNRDNFDKNVLFRC